MNVETSRNFSHALLTPTNHPSNCAARIALRPSVRSPFASWSFPVACTMPLRPCACGIHARSSVESDVGIHLTVASDVSTRAHHRVPSFSHCVLALLIILAFMARAAHFTSFSLACRLSQSDFFRYYISPSRASFFQSAFILWYHFPRAPPFPAFPSRAFNT